MDNSAKHIYCIRHGESTFNEWRTKSLWNFSWIWIRDPMIIDAPLSAKGQAQVAQLHQTVVSSKLDEKIEVIITSPLTRAIQTAMGGFLNTKTPIILEPCCREMLDTACDIGRSPHDLARAFENLNVDFSVLEEIWWLEEEMRQEHAGSGLPLTPAEVLRLRETTVDLDKRICTLLKKLLALPQHHIAIVGHSAFFKRMLRMNRKLRNCELYEVSLNDVARLHGLL